MDGKENLERRLNPSRGDIMISVIVPVFNAEKYIENCILSILNQTYPHFELILINDGSTDRSMSICQQFENKDQRIKILHQSNQGVSSARNLGILNAQGDYITFVDADDTLEKEALETALDFLVEKNADVVVYSWRIVNTIDGITSNFVLNSTDSEDITDVISEILQHYSEYGGGYPWNKLWKRDAIISNGEDFPLFDRELFYFEDLEWVIRMMLRIHKVVVCPEHLYSYYIHEESVTHSKSSSERKEIGYHQSINRVIEDLSYLPNLQKEFSDKYYPEIVNGLIHAKRHKWKNLWDFLFVIMKKKKNYILKSKNISIKIKLRCIVLFLLGCTIWKK